jgi:hypothetical protein
MAEIGDNLNIICMESEAFYALVDRVVDRLKKQHKKEQNIWIDEEEAMELLRIKSKTTLQKFRDQGKIRFTQPTRKLILYDRNSILEFLESHAKDTF